MTDLNSAELAISIRLPGDNAFRADRRITISESVARCLMPLPRDRELWFARLDMRRAQEMQRQRQELRRQLTSQIEAVLVEIMSSRDPTNGYTPEEWQTITASPP